MKTTPFTYLLKFKPTGQFYYGSRYGKNCHPSQLWSTYFTSSKKIKSLIEQYGADSFEYEIRKTFETREQASEWETKFLVRVRAAQSDKWLNQHNGSKNFYCTGHHGLLGFKQSEETKQKRRLANLGKKRPACTEERREKIRKSATGRKHSDESKKIMSQKRKGVVKSEEHKSKLFTKLTVQCPYCDKSGQKLNMIRHHFDNCKLKPL
jgi:hypothetical protein